MVPTRLFSPLTIRDVTLKNRLWVSPMCQYSASGKDGIAQRWHDVHYGALSSGGAGLVMLEATAVVPEGRISPVCLGIWSDDHIEGLLRITDFAHDHGAAMGIQLAHAGRKASTYPWLPDAPSGSVPFELGGWQTVAPSAIAFEGLAEPRALEIDQIDATVDAFVAAADRAVRAGFDVLEIHAAHGYLIHEFLSPLSNAREDEYGGSIENRARLVRRIVTAVRASHPTVPIFVRISATDWEDRGFTLSDAITLAGWLTEDGADLIDVSSGGNTASPHIPARASYQVPLASEIRNHSDARVAAVGLITQSAQAESIVTTGQADAVFVGRAALRNPRIGHEWAREVHAKDQPIPNQLWRAYPQP